MEFECKLEYLADIVEELTAREVSNNCVVQPLMYKSWKELCEDGIRLFKELGGHYAAKN
jgi:hypothetical protein